MEQLSSGKIFSGVFFEKFMQITYVQTLVVIGILLLSFYFLKKMQDKKIDFSIRMLVGLGFGIAIGLSVQIFAGLPDKNTVWMVEAANWYGLIGRAFIAFIRMLVIPLIFVSIVKVILDFAGKEDLPKIAFRGIFWLLFTTAIACIVGILLANFMDLSLSDTSVSATPKPLKNIIDTFVSLIPNNIVSAMAGENIVGLVIFSALVGMAANRSEKKFPEAIANFKILMTALYRIVMSVAMTVIKYMPYAVVALLARTVISSGLPAIIEVSGFILAIYIAMFIMMVIHIVIVMLHGVSPVMYIKKSLGTWLMAFTSRSSVGTLPMTISTLTNRMGVNVGSANLIGSLGTTMGMNGCAGFFPALLTVMVAHSVGIQTDMQFYVMLVIVVVIGSIGIAGIPGTATVAATVVLSGMGMGEYFAIIGIVLAVDPVIDMARTLANVSGSLTAAVATDREMGQMDMDVFNDPLAGLEVSE